MSSANTLTGRNGKFSAGGTVIARTTKWDVNPTLAGGAEWGDSDSAGFTNRAPGRKDATFNAEGKYDTSAEVWDIFQPGDICACLLYVSARALAGRSDLYEHSALGNWSFPRALCNDFSLSVDIDTEEVLGWSSSWGADGAFTYP